VIPFQYSPFISPLAGFWIAIVFSSWCRSHPAPLAYPTDVGLSVFDFVNGYYEQVSPIIRTFKGFIVKYMGDGIMTVFPNRAEDALQAAIPNSDASRNIMSTG
jgi:hypothetical protein